MRKYVALAILVLYFAVVIEGMVRGEYSAAVTAMAPALSIAAGYLLGRDMIDIFIQRKQREDLRSQDKADDRAEREA